MNRKYLVMSNGKSGPFAVVFNSSESHDLIARRLGGENKVLGAGAFSFYSSVEGNFHLSCYGKSSTLGIGSRGWEDALVLQYAIFGFDEEVVIDNERPKE